MNDSTLLKIKNELDIVNIVSEFVDLSKKGRNYWGVCPFHEDTNPSMSVSPDKQLFKCFVCGTGGDLIKFNSLINKISFRESLVQLAEKIGIKVEMYSKKEKVYSETDSKILKANEDAMLFFQYSLNTENGKQALAYAEERNLSSAIRDEFLIGYAPNSGLIDFLKKKGHDEATVINSSLATENGGDFFRNRLIFGIKNNEGKIVAFSGRDIEGTSNAKYINSAMTRVFDKSNVLYNYSNSREQINQSKEVFINEGFTDVIAMSRAGMNNSVAIMGTSLTSKHTNLLRGKTVNLMLDGDKAGIAATIKSIATLLKEDIKTFVVKPFENLDPNDVLEKYGVEKLLEVAKVKIEALAYIYELHKQKFNNGSPQEIEDFIKSFSKYLENQTSIKVDFYKNLIKKDLGVSDESLNSILKNTPSKVKEVKKEKPLIIRRNYSYSLIMSMIKNKSFINLLEKEQIHFTEQILPAIVRYIKKFESGEYEPADQELKLKIAEIKNYKSVDSDAEFMDLIKRVNTESKEWKIEEYKVKLENTSDETQKIKFANKIRVLKKELIKE